MKGKSKASKSPSLFGEETIEHEPIKKLELKKVKLEQSVIEQTLFDIQALPVQVKRVKQKEVEKVIPLQNKDTPCYRLFFPFEHHKYGLMSVYNMDNPATVEYYKNLKLKENGL